MMPTIAGVFAGFLVVGAVMLTLERLWPANRDQPVLRRGLLLDGA